MSRALGPEALTPRECEVIEAWIDVGVYKLVAERLGISEETVKNYATSVIEKMDTRSFGQAAVRYDRWVRGWKALIW